MTLQTKSKLKWPEGTELLCSECGKVVCKTARNIYSMMRRSSKDFDFVQPIGEPFDGLTPCCKKKLIVDLSGYEAALTNIGWVSFWVGDDV